MERIRERMKKKEMYIFRVIVGQQGVDSAGPTEKCRASPPPHQDANEFSHLHPWRY